MKSQDQVLLEQAYNQVQKEPQAINIGTDSEGFYKPHVSTSGEVLKDRFFYRFSPEGEFIQSRTNPPLMDGQFLVRGTPYVQVFVVKKAGEDFQGILTQDYPREPIMDYIHKRHAKAQEAGLRHFFPKDK